MGRSFSGEKKLVKERFCVMVYLAVCQKLEKQREATGSYGQMSATRTP